MTGTPLELNDPVAATPVDSHRAPHAFLPERLLVWLSLAGMLIVPLIFAPGLMDRFRIIKESASRTEALVGSLLIVVTCAYGSRERIRQMLREKTIVLLLLAGIAWTGITTLTSTNRLLSIESLVTLITSALLFIVVWYAAPSVSLVVLDLLVPVVVANTTLAALQEYAIWNPFTVPAGTLQHFTANAFIGNPNLVGAYLSLAALILIVGTITVPGFRRVFYSIGAAAAVAGVLISQARSGVLTLVAGAVILGLATRRRAIVTVAVGALVIGIAVMLDLRAVTSLIKAPELIEARQLNALTSQRFVASLTAIEMFRTSPFTGLGPGTFPLHYFPYRSRLSERYPADLLTGNAAHFEVTHNEHLQLLAETGVPGYLLFLAFVAAIVFTVRRGRHDESEDIRGRVARELIIPFTVAFLVLCVAQFPLHVAVTKHLIVSIAALLAGWSRL